MNNVEAIIEGVSEDFLMKLRAGGTPEINDYASQYPQFATQIAEQLESIQLLELLGHCETTLRKQINANRTAADIDSLGDFDIVGVLGRGGMGVVYEAIDRTLQRRVALKVLNDSALATQRKVDRFRQESRLAAQLHHTNIVSVFGVGEENGRHFYAMQYIEGISLHDVLLGLNEIANASNNSWGTISGSVEVARALCTGDFAESRLKHPKASERDSDSSGLRADVVPPVDEATIDVASDGRSLSSSKGFEPSLIDKSSRTQFGTSYWRSVARIGIQVAEALQYAHHNGILHRDVKPANLLFDPDGTVWVADFGLAKVAETDDFTNTGDVVGTLRYMAPEQLSGRADERTDVYSLGLTLYELLTLSPACGGTTYKQLFGQKQDTKPLSPRAANPAIPFDLSTIVQKALEHEPERRYGSARELSEDLRRYLDDSPIQARRITFLERTWRWCRRNRASAVSIATVMASLLLVSFISVRSYVREAEHKGQAERMLSAVLDELDGLYGPYLGYEATATSDLGGTVVNDGNVFSPAMLSKDAAMLLERTVSVYDRLAKEEVSSDNRLLALEAAEARRRVGDLYRQLGQFETAIAAYKAAEKSYQELSANEPSLGIELARIQVALGSILEQRQQHAESRKAYQRALDLLADAPYSDARQLGLARAHYLMGKRQITEGVEERGVRRGGFRQRFDWAKKESVQLNARDRATHLNEAVKILEQLQKNGSNDSYLFLRALCLRDMPEQPDARADAIALLRDLVEEFPQVARYRFELCETYRSSTDVSQLERIEQLGKAQVLAEQLAAEHDTIAAYRLSLAHIYAHLGGQLRRLKEYREGENFTRKSIGVHESIVRDFPGLAELSKELANNDKIRLAGWIQQENRHRDVITLLAPLGERLFEHLESIEVGDRADAEEKDSTQNAARFLGSCAQLLLRSYQATGDDIGYFIALGWLDAAEESRFPQ